MLSPHSGYFPVRTPGPSEPRNCNRKATWLERVPDRKLIPGHGRV